VSQRQILERAGIRITHVEGAMVAPDPGTGNEARIDLPRDTCLKLVLIDDIDVARRVREQTLEVFRKRYGAEPAASAGAFDSIPTVARSAVALTIEGQRATFDTAVIAGRQKAVMVIATTPIEDHAELAARIRQMLSTLQIKD
jgi:hypothetical protein